MKTTKSFFLFAFCLAAIFLSNCKSDDAMFGEIHGVITDNETNKPLQDVSVILNEDSIMTGGDGSYLIKELEPGDYDIQAVKPGYMKKTTNVTVSAEKTGEVNFALAGSIIISDPKLDFGVEYISREITVSKAGNSTMNYTLRSDQSWIVIDPASGVLTDKTETIKINITKPASSQSIMKGEIVVTSSIGQETQQDKISVLVNGALDRDGYYYKVVKIGDQYWMAENTHAGVIVAGGMEQNDPLIIKKYSYDTEYGGLYTFSGMMRGAAADNKTVGTTNGVCPVGWHVPTQSEWNTLINFLGEPVSGVKLKEAGVTHWNPGNVATNESGFTALPGGMYDGTAFGLLKSHGFFWTGSSDGLGHYYALQFEHNAEKGFYKLYQNKEACSVRCVRNP